MIGKDIYVFQALMTSSASATSYGPRSALNVQAGLIARFIATVVLSILMIAKSSVGLMPQLNPIEDIVHVADRLTGMTLPLRLGELATSSSGQSHGASSMRRCRRACQRPRSSRGLFSEL